LSGVVSVLGAEPGVSPSKSMFMNGAAEATAGVKVSAASRAPRRQKFEAVMSVVLK
jgi:hypothetical protein